MKAHWIESQAQCPDFQNALEEAAKQLEADRTFWNRHLKTRMTFDEYMLRKDLTRQIKGDGPMNPDRARDIINEF